MKKELRSKRIEGRVKPSLYKRVKKAMGVANYRTDSEFLEDALIEKVYRIENVPSPKGIPVRELRRMLKVNA